MAYVKYSRYLWLLVIILAVWAARQYTMTNDSGTKHKLPYLCDRKEPETKTTQPACCMAKPCCANTCPACVSNALTFEATNAPRIYGLVEVILGSDNVRTVESAADLTTRRNFISDTLFRSLEPGRDAERLAEVDVHSVDVFGRNVTITEFVRLNIRVSTDEKVLTDEIFEIVPNRKSEEGFVTINLLLGLDLLEDAGALGINPGLFFKNVDR